MFVVDSSSDCHLRTTVSGSWCFITGSRSRLARSHESRLIPNRRPRPGPAGGTEGLVDSDSSLWVGHRGYVGLGALGAAGGEPGLEGGLATNPEQPEPVPFQTVSTQPRVLVSRVSEVPPTAVTPLPEAG